jgi:hypothetical protein
MAVTKILPFQLKMNKYRLSFGLDGLLRFHREDFVTRVNPPAEPPPLLSLAWVYWATSARVSVMARVEIRHRA